MSILNSSLVRKSVVFSAAIALLGPVARATPFNESIGINGGTLSWTVTPQPVGGPCSGTMYNSSNFSYAYSVTSPQGTVIPITVALAGGAGYIDGSSGPPYCPPNGPEPATTILSDSSSFYRFTFSPADRGAGSATMESFATGAVYPTYLVVSIAYAPPAAGNSNGNQSYVDYTNTTELGSDTTFSSSFQDSDTLTMTASLLDVKGSISSQYSQEEDTSQSIAIDQSSSMSNSYPGDYPANVVGLDHDNDIILVWLNPALDCAAEAAWSYSPSSFPAAIQCVEYDPKGAPGDPDSQYGIQDIVEIAAGVLNGDYPMQTQLSTLLQQHGLTSTDLANILAQDPFGTCGANISCVTQVGTPDARFYSDGVAVDFENLGTTHQYTLTYKETNTDGEGGSSSFSLGFTLSGSLSFKNIWSATLTRQNTLTWTNKWNTTTTSMTGQSALATLVEPPPGVPYSGPIQFGVFQDNVYGTFMFYPTEQ